MECDRLSQGLRKYAPQIWILCIISVVLNITFITNRTSNRAESIAKSMASSGKNSPMILDSDDNPGLSEHGLKPEKEVDYVSASEDRIKRDTDDGYHIGKSRRKGHTVSPFSILSHRNHKNNSKNKNNDDNNNRRLGHDASQGKRLLGQFHKYHIKSESNYFLSVKDSIPMGVRSKNESSRFEYGNKLPIGSSTVCDSLDVSDCQTFLKFIDIKSQQTEETKYLCMNASGDMYAANDTDPDCLFERMVIKGHQSENPTFVLASVYHPIGPRRHRCRRVPRCKRIRKKTRKTRKHRCFMETVRHYLCVNKQSGALVTRETSRINDGCRFIEEHIELKTTM